MKTLKRWSLLISTVGLIALLVVGAVTFSPALAQGPGGMMGQSDCDEVTSGGHGPGGMMGYGQPGADITPCGFNTMGYGMMGGSMMGGNMMGGGMMSSLSPFFTADPLTLTEASEAVNDYLDGLNDSSLALGEVMVFDNHAYAQIVERETGIGAMEVLVDSATKAVYPEMGPNMMWNLKYGMMVGFGGNGMMGMMGGSFGFNNMDMMGNATTPEIS